jgi:hypothetical protein
LTGIDENGSVEVAGNPAKALGLEFPALLGAAAFGTMSSKAAKGFGLPLRSIFE